MSQTAHKFDPSILREYDIRGIVGGTVHPGDAPALENATVIIDGQKIQAVGVGLAVPAGATVIDAKGKIVTPGLFDPYTRLGLVEIEQIDDTNDVDAGGDPIRAAQRAASVPNTSKSRRYPPRPMPKSKRPSPN